MSGLSRFQQGCLDAYAAACSLIPSDLRHAFILIGGAATVFHWAREREPKDVDIAACSAAHVLLWEAAGNRREGFCLNDTDGSITWDVPVRDSSPFRVNIEVLELPGEFIPFTPSVCAFRNGFVATLPELVRLRASILVERSDKTDYTDLKLLLNMTKERRLVVSDVGHEELGVLLEAVGMLGGDEFGGHLVSILHSSTLRRYGLTQIYIIVFWTHLPNSDILSELIGR